ncbi:class I adenylate-forming enzyme family protein [Spirillospora sp. CA-255316]
MGALLARCHADYADLPALVDGPRTWTYAELGAAVRAFAADLARRGVPRGGRVVLLAENSAEFVIAEQALFVSGRVRVALSPKLTAQELATILDDCAPALIVTDEPREATARAAMELAGLPVPTVVPALTGDPEPAEEPEPPRPSDVAAFLYTSGTTGRPKGAVLTHGAWMAMTRNSLAEMPVINPGDRVLDAAPLSHLGGYLALCYTARGACRVIHRRFDPARVLAEIEHGGVDHLPAVPTMIGLLVAHADSLGRPVGGALRSVVYAASPSAAPVLRRAVELFGPVFVQFYGLSEIPMPLTCLSARDHVDPDLLGSAGRVTPFVTLRIVGRDGADVPRGEVGEVWAAADTVMTGYHQRTTDAMTGQWFRTGDLGRLDRRGYLHLLGRADDVIITGGHNVHPQEVEAVLTSLAPQCEVAVFGTPDETWGEIVTAAVVPADPGGFDAGALLAEARAVLAPYKIPRKVQVVESLPRNSLGKILRRRLRAVS